VVTVSYPEVVNIQEEYYNSAITVNAKGETIANYKKSFLYYQDNVCGMEGLNNFYNGLIPRLGIISIRAYKLLTKDQKC
jgi:protein N-terminal amidase